MRATTFADFIIIALAMPCIALVLTSYLLLVAALIANVREKFYFAASGMNRRAPAEN